MWHTRQERGSVSSVGSTYRCGILSGETLVVDDCCSVVSLSMTGSAMLPRAKDIVLVSLMFIGFGLREGDELSFKASVWASIWASVLSGS